MQDAGTSASATHENRICIIGCGRVVTALLATCADNFAADPG